MRFISCFPRLLFLFCILSISVQAGPNITRDGKPNWLRRPQQPEHYKYSEERLMKKILSPPLYQRDLRPINPTGAATNLSAGFALRQIIDLVEKHQVIVLSMWIRLKWFDRRLKWTRSPELDLDTIVLPASRIWVPDIALYDSTGGIFLHQIYPYRARVSSSGFVQLQAPVRVSSTCRLDVTGFPFDRQLCPLTFGPWTYNGDEVMMQAGLMDGENNYIPNGEWELETFSGDSNLRYYSCCDEPYSDVTLKVGIRRRSLFYIFNLAFPAFLLTFLAILGFFLPAESGEKCSMNVTILLSLTVFLLILSDMMPSTSESLPLIGKCFGSMMLLVSVCCTTSVCVLNVHYRGRVKQLPDWFKKVCFKFLIKVTRISLYGNWKAPITKEYFQLEEHESNGNAASPFEVDDSSLIQPVDTHANLLTRENPKRLDSSPGNDQHQTKGYVLCKERALDIDEQWKVAAKILDQFISLLVTMAYIGIMSLMLTVDFY